MNIIFYYTIRRKLISATISLYRRVTGNYTDGLLRAEQAQKASHTEYSAARPFPSLVIRERSFSFLKAEMVYYYLRTRSFDGRFEFVPGKLYGATVMD